MRENATWTAGPKAGGVPIQFPYGSHLKERDGNWKNPICVNGLCSQFPVFPPDPPPKGPTARRGSLRPPLSPAITL